MKRSDLDAVVEIERYAFKAPWSRQVFVEELTREWAYIDVIREGSRPRDVRACAFINYWLVHDEVHILNIATHPERRGRGYASKLLEHVLNFAERRECRYVTLEVRRSNQAAMRIYRRFGFRAVGVRPNYYTDDREDAIVMLLDRGEQASDKGS